MVNKDFTTLSIHLKTTEVLTLYSKKHQQDLISDWYVRVLRFAGV